MINKTKKYIAPDENEFELRFAESEEIGLENSSEFVEMEAEMKSLFANLRLVGNSGKMSIEDVLNKAIIEGERFIEWQNSDRPLTNIRLFRKNDGELVPYSPPQFSFFNLFESTGKLKIIENSQFEIWECNENDKPYFPLYRIPLSKVCEKGKIFISEELRNHWMLKIKAERVGEYISFTFSIRSSASELSLSKLIQKFIYNQIKILFVMKNPIMNFSAFCFILLFFISSINIVRSKPIEKISVICANINNFYEKKDIRESRQEDLDKDTKTKDWAFKISNTNQIKPSSGT